LEVKPFEEEFIAAQSQSMGGGGDRGLQGLAEAQKDIIVATWKLDARARRARCQIGRRHPRRLKSAVRFEKANGGGERPDGTRRRSTPAARRWRPGPG